MFTWNKSEHKLMKEYKNHNINSNFHFKFSVEYSTSQKDKIEFVDSLSGGKLSYILDICKKFESEKEKLKRSKETRIIPRSVLSNWIKKNDSMKLFNRTLNLGAVQMYGCTRNIQNSMLTKSATLDTYDNYVDEIFHRCLMRCKAEEVDHFLQHDPYSIGMKNLLYEIQLHNTTFGLPLVIKSDNEILIEAESGCERNLTESEINSLKRSYEDLDKFMETESKKLIEIFKEENKN